MAPRGSSSTSGPTHLVGAADQLDRSAQGFVIPSPQRQREAVRNLRQAYQPLAARPEPAED